MVAEAAVTTERSSVAMKSRWLCNASRWLSKGVSLSSNFSNSNSATKSSVQLQWRRQLLRLTRLRKLQRGLRLQQPLLHLQRQQLRQQLLLRPLPLHLCRHHRQQQILCTPLTKQQVAGCNSSKHWPLRLAHSARAWAAAASAPALQVAQVACPSPDN